MGRGLLTGRWQKTDDLPADDYRRLDPRFQGDNFEHNVAVVNKVHELARDKGCTSSQLALAWVLAQGDDIVPIPGTRRLRYLEENLAALDVALTDDDLRHLDEAAPKGAVAGDRYEDMSAVNR